MCLCCDVARLCCDVTRLCCDVARLCCDVTRLYCDVTRLCCAIRSCCDVTCHVSFTDASCSEPLGLFAKGGGGASSAKKLQKSRTAFRNQQRYVLEKRFLYQKYLTPTDRDEIASSLGLSNAQVITWFQNRRAKLKRDLEELKADVTASSDDTPPDETPPTKRGHVAPPLTSSTVTSCDDTNSGGERGGES